MKKMYLKIACVATVASVMVTACGGTKAVSVTDNSAMKKTFNEEAEVEIKDLPCTGSDFYSTKDLIRANGIGESMDQQMAKRMSRQAALEDLSTKIGVSVNALISDYYKSTKQAMTEDLKRRFEGGTDLVVKERISGYRTICEKYTRNKNNNNSYKCYMCIELGADDMAKAVHNKLTEDQILRVDYDYEKFRNRFNEELAKQDTNK
ncbi:hypothetical protein AGMMS4956_12670 [Bacteroidia bacterium]|nr:hypothetical protein AGMMS4956_12670 [Bacteroidia bacterium]